MTQVYDSIDLTGKLLIAMPGMGDPQFAHSVVLICAHSADGAMGLIINKPVPELEFSTLLDQLGIPSGQGGCAIHFGGPVEHGRGFVLHSSDYRAEVGTLQIDDKFGMTATLDILRDIAGAAGPKQAFLALGYAGWGPDQLEEEIRQNGWLTCEADPDLVFATGNALKWGAALKGLGVDPLTLSAQAGHA